jgi:hypothetical protein
VAESCHGLRVDAMIYVMHVAAAQAIARAARSATAASAPASRLAIT